MDRRSGAVPPVSRAGDLVLYPEGPAVEPERRRGDPAGLWRGLPGDGREAAPGAAGQSGGGVPHDDGAAAAQADAANRGYRGAGAGVRPPARADPPPAARPVVQAGAAAGQRDALVQSPDLPAAAGGGARSGADLRRRGGSPGGRGDPAGLQRDPAGLRPPAEGAEPGGAVHPLLRRKRSYEGTFSEHPGQAGPQMGRTGAGAGAAGHGGGGVYLRGEGVPGRGAER